MISKTLVAETFLPTTRKSPQHESLTAAFCGSGLITYLLEIGCSVPVQHKIDKKGSVAHCFINCSKHGSDGENTNTIRQDI